MQSVTVQRHKPNVPKRPCTAGGIPRWGHARSFLPKKQPVEALIGAIARPLAEERKGFGGVCGAICKRYTLGTHAAAFAPKAAC